MDRDLTSQATTWIERLGQEAEAFEAIGHECKFDHRCDVVVNTQPSGLPLIGLVVETKSRLTPREALALRRPGEPGICAGLGG